MPKKNNAKKKPVIILTGYLGSGKTTVMKELLLNPNSKKIAVIVNDMADLPRTAKCGGDPIF